MTARNVTWRRYALVFVLPVPILLVLLCIPLVVSGWGWGYVAGVILGNTVSRYLLFAVPICAAVRATAAEPPRWRLPGHTLLGVLVFAVGIQLPILGYYYMAVKWFNGSGHHVLAWFFLYVVDNLHCTAFSMLAFWLVARASSSVAVYAEACIPAGIVMTCCLYLCHGGFWLLSEAGSFLLSMVLGALLVLVMVHKRLGPKPAARADDTTDNPTGRWGAAIIMTTWQKRAVMCAGGLLVVYVGAYAIFRATNTHEWWGVGSNGLDTYVRFPPGTAVLYYLWYPLVKADEFKTHARPHISRTRHAPVNCCPECGSEQVHVMSYGRAQEGGCVLTADSPTVACDVCRHRWKDFRQLVPWL